MESMKNSWVEVARIWLEEDGNEIISWYVLISVAAGLNPYDENQPL
jgi:hypothetical protein